MQWQDFVLTLGMLVFVVALLPATLSKDKPPLLTSLPTSIFLFIFTFTYLTMHLYLTAFAAFLTAVLWSTLAAQKYMLWREGKKKEL